MQINRWTLINLNVNPSRFRGIRRGLLLTGSKTSYWSMTRDTKCRTVQKVKSLITIILCIISKNSNRFVRVKYL